MMMMKSDMMVITDSINDDVNVLPSSSLEAKTETWFQLKNLMTSATAWNSSPSLGLMRSKYSKLQGLNHKLLTNGASCGVCSFGHSL